MTIKEAQDTVDKWIKQYGVRYFSELTNMACLTEEVGELVHKCALHEKAMKGMKNSSPLPLHFLHIGIGFFLHCF